MRFGFKEHGHHHRRHESRPDMGFGRRGGRERGFDPRRAERPFGRDELRLMLLSLIGEKERHGYELAKAIEALSGGTYAPSPGSVYPTLAMMAAAGLIVGTDDESARRSFALTDLGRAELERAAPRIAELRERLQGLASESNKADATPVRRAIHNLHAVIEAQVMRPGASREQMLQAAALLDEAAQKIERL